ncbi:hypothetical protein [Salibacterium lacus]|uniref:Uncharacterized protein n=1 Tax=Salibacterium lacus TaxID=1898109 RepID=A0ABW5T4S4_9BACI
MLKLPVMPAVFSYPYQESNHSTAESKQKSKELMQKWGESIEKSGESTEKLLPLMDPPHRLKTSPTDA